MDNLSRAFSRRRALKLGAGLAGTLALTSSNLLPALAENGQPTIKSADTVGTRQDPGEPDYWQRVNQVFQTTGMLEPGNVFKVAIPRTDLTVVVAGVTLKPGFMVEHMITFF